MDGQEPVLVAAPDGMPVRVLPVDPTSLMGAAVGYLAPHSRFAVHAHLSLEQLTYVIRGRVRITMRGPASEAPDDRIVVEGEAITNPPMTTLSFANESDDPAELLFVCAPPYPADDADVILTDTHRRLTAAEWSQHDRRAAAALETFRAVASARRSAGQ